MKISNRSKHIIISLSLFAAATGCTAHNASNNNMDVGNPYNPEAGSYVWGKNEKDSVKPEFEKTHDEIVQRQKEVLKRQELEQERLEKEKQDILRQQQYNEQLRELQN